VADSTSPMYRQLLEEALELGRADGRFAAAFETSGGEAEAGRRCLGRTPEEFARLLWNGPGEPPSGLELNAPLWYATGFAEGLASARHGPAGARARCTSAGCSPDRFVRRCPCHW
jgi:hypothetical protein